MVNSCYYLKMKNNRLNVFLLLIPFGIIGYWLLSNNFNVTTVLSIQLDKIGHIFGFLLLTWLIHKLIKLPITNLSICLIFYAALTEIGQHYLGFRKGEVSDFIADIMGVYLYRLIHWLATDRRRESI